MHKFLHFPSPFPSLSLIHASLEWALTRLQASGLVDSFTRIEGSHSNYTSHTHRYASLMVLRYTTFVPPLWLHIKLDVRQASALIQEGACASPLVSKRQRERQYDEWLQVKFITYLKT